MGGFGFGFGAGYGHGHKFVFGGGSPGGGSTVEPSPAWNGTAESGFSILPSDPARTTAKPAVRLVTVPNTYFLDSEVVGVAAYANDSGTLIGGIDRVRFHFEGNFLDVVEPSLRPFTRRDGSTYLVFGYWATLRKPSEASGTAHLYVEAIPADGTMQRRVIGPYAYFPVEPFAGTNNAHDAEVTVTPSQPISVGVNYQTVGAALTYCRSTNRKNPLITITENIVNEDLDNTNAPSGQYVFQGWCTIRTAPGVAVSYAKPSYAGDVASNLRLQINGVKFEGDHTFDMRRMQTILPENLGGKGLWFDRVRFINSAGRGELWRKGVRPFKPVLYGLSYVTDCEFTAINDPLVDHIIARGNICDQTYGDIATSGKAVHGNIVTDHKQSTDFNFDVTAITITGPANATVAISGGVDASTRTITLKVSGSQVSTFVVGSSEARYNTANGGSYDATTAGQGYNVQDVADWINSLSGWSAAVHDDARRASMLGIPGTKGVGFGDTSASSGITLSTTVDYHADFYQQSGHADNVIIDGNRVYDTECAMFLTGADTAINTLDCIIINNAMMNSVATGQYYDPTNGFSQFQKKVHSHFVFAHNTMAFQGILMVAASGFNPDGYSMVAANSLTSLTWNGTPDPDLTIKDNVIDSGGSSPAGAIGTVLGGNYSSKFAGADSGDFTPAGVLAVNFKTPVVRHDLFGQDRVELCAAGAVA